MMFFLLNRCQWVKLLVVLGSLTQELAWCFKYAVLIFSICIFCRTTACRLARPYFGGIKPAVVIA